MGLGVVPNRVTGVEAGGDGGAGLGGRRGLCLQGKASRFRKTGRSWRRCRSRLRGVSVLDAAELRLFTHG